MLVRGRSTTALVLSVLSYLFTPAIFAKHQNPVPEHFTPVERSTPVVSGREGHDRSGAYSAGRPDRFPGCVSRQHARDEKKTPQGIEANLHGATGEVTVLADPNPDLDRGRDAASEACRNARGNGLKPWDYNGRMRDLILRFAEPDLGN